MASVFESILGVLLISTTLVVVTLLIVSNSAHDAVRQGQSRQLIYSEDQAEAAIGTILESTEQKSSLTIEQLIGISVVDIDTIVTRGNWTVNITDEMGKRLEAVYGPNKTYLIVSPVVRGINLQFVIDTSSSVEAERSTIMANLQAIQQNLTLRIRNRGDEQVHTQIYLLPSVNNSGCQQIDDLNLPLTRCTALTDPVLYAKLANWSAPTFGLGQNVTWATQIHAAKTLDYAQSDWAAGAAFAALEYNESAYLKSITSINIIMPLSDELATTSKRDSCFNLVNYADWLICTYCDESCPVNRSRSAVAQAVGIINQTSSIVNPIYSVNCDFQQNPLLNQLATSPRPYVQNFSDTPGIAFTPAKPNWCDQNKCTACKAGSPSYCFHSDCYPALQQDMDLLANATRGQRLNVNNPEEIPEQVLASYDTFVQQYGFVIGKKDAERDHFVYEKVIRLPNGDLSKITLWVYR